MDNHEHEYATAWAIEVSDDSRIKEGVVVVRKVGVPQVICRVCGVVCEDCVTVEDSKSV